MHINGKYPCHPDNCRYGRAQKVEYLVYHYVGALGTAEQNARYYSTTPGIGASAHYFVGHGPDAEVYASVGEHDTAWHCGRSDGKYKHPGCRNANSIGIELCCHRDAAGAWYIDRETVDRAAALGREIMDRYGIPIDRVLRHYDVTGKICPAPWVEDPAAWEDLKARLEEPEMTQEQFNIMFHNAMTAYEAALSAKPAAGFAEEARQWAMGQGITDGARPYAAATRQELWTMLHRREMR